MPIPATPGTSRKPLAYRLMIHINHPIIGGSSSCGGVGTGTGTGTDGTGTDGTGTGGMGGTGTGTTVGDGSGIDRTGGCGTGGANSCTTTGMVERSTRAGNTGNDGGIPTTPKPTTPTAVAMLATPSAKAPASHTSPTADRPSPTPLPADHRTWFSFWR